jgi:hypothetical protein
MYKKGDLIHYKEEDWYESLLKVITDERNDQCTIRTFACDSDEHTKHGGRKDIQNYNRSVDQGQGTGLGPVHALARTHERVLGPVK